MQRNNGFILQKRNITHIYAYLLLFFSIIVLSVIIVKERFMPLFQAWKKAKGK